MSTLRTCRLVIAILVAGALPARANLITNGSFESGPGDSIDNWTLTPTATASIANDYPTASGASPYGVRFLTFNAGLDLPSGSATQDFGPLDATTTYQLSFAYGAIGTSGSQTLEVTINTTSAPLPAQTYVINTPSLDFGVLWQRATFTFVGAINAVPRGVTFADLGVTTLLGDSDLLVDDVSLVAVVPEAAAGWLVAIGAAVAGARRLCRALAP